MATGDKKTNFAQKRILSQQRIDDTFFGYLQAVVKDVTSRVWANRRGVYGELDIGIGTVDKVSVTTLPAELLDGDGNILILESADGANLDFENTNGATYYLAAKHVEIPSGTITNPRTALVDYDLWEDRIGVSADPNSVSEVAGQLQIVVDSVFESSVDHSGRRVTAFLKNAVIDDEAVAVERDLVVVYSGGQNIVTTAGLLGQPASGASTTPADYTVIATGVTIRKNTNLSSVDPYSYIGSVTGGGAGNPPSGKSTVGQIDVSDGINPDLQSAYGAGRVINTNATDGGAVKIQSIDSGDQFKACLHVSREGSTEVDPFGVVSVGDEDDGFPLAALIPLKHSSGALNVQEAATLESGAGSFTLTRGGVNLTTAGVSSYCDVAVLSGFATAAVNRMYIINGASGSGASVKEFDGSTVSPWPNGETGSVTFYRMRFGVGPSAKANGNHGLYNLAINGPNELPAGSYNNYALSVRPHASDNGVGIYSNEETNQAPVSKFSERGNLEMTLLGKIDPTDRAEHFNSMIKIYRGGLSGSDGPGFGLMFQAGSSNGSEVPFAFLEPIKYQTVCPDEIQFDQTGTQTVDATGVGINFLNSTLALKPEMGLFFVIWSGAEAGLYVVKPGTITTHTFDVMPIGSSGAPPTWSGSEELYGQFLKARFWVGGDRPHASEAGDGTACSLLTGLTWNCFRGDLDTPKVCPVRILPGLSTSDHVFEVQSGNKTTSEYVRLSISGDGIAQIGQPYNVGITGQYAPGGLKIYTKANGSGEADKYALQVFPPEINANNQVKPSARSVGLFSHLGLEMRRWQGNGRWAYPSRLFDDFFYMNKGITPNTSKLMGGIWDVDVSGSVGTVTANNNTGSDCFYQGLVNLATGSTNGDTCIVQTGNIFKLYRSATQDWYTLNIAGRIRATDVVNSRCWLRWRAAAATECCFGAKIQGSTIYIATKVGALEQTTGIAIGTKVVGSPESGWKSFWLRYDHANSEVVGWIEGMSYPLTISIQSPSDSNWQLPGYLELSIETLENGSNQFEVDYIDAWVEDLNAKNGPLE